MDSHTVLNLAVFAIEIILAVSLISWMRSSLRGTPAPWSFIAQVLIAGALVALAAALVTVRYSFDITALTVSRPDIVEHYKGILIIFNTVGAALVEELAKYAVGVFFLIHNRHTTRLSDVIICMVIVGLGFSLIEDAFYFLDPSTIAPYRLLSFYLHSGTSAIMGYSLGRFRFGLTGYRELFLAVIAAVALHTGYNLTTQLNNGQIALYLTFAITLLITLQIFVLVKRTQNEEWQLRKLAEEKPKPTRYLNLKPKEV